MKFALLGLILMSICQNAFAQGILERHYVGQYLATIPDPENLLANVVLSYNQSVAFELKLSQGQYDSIVDLIRKSGGSLAYPSVVVELSPVRDRKVAISERVREVKSMDMSLFPVMTAAKSVENRTRVEELLRPEQLDRLREIAYQVEISRAGLSEAMIDGFLGKKVGIRDDQKPALRIHADRIQANESKAILELQKRVYYELFDRLDPEQTASAKNLLGDLHILYDVCQRTNLNDPDNLLAITSLATNPSVARVLRITDVERDSIDAFVRESNGSPENPPTSYKVNGKRLSQEQWKAANDKKLKENLNWINDILDPNQVDRLRQIAYQIEIAKFGLRTAITEGFLARKLEIREEQKPSMSEAASKSEKKLSEERMRIEDKSKSDFFKELEPLQRASAITAVGKPFVFQDEPYNGSPRYVAESKE